MTRLTDSVAQKLHVDVHETLALAEAAETIARRLRSRAALAFSLRAKGNALRALRRFRESTDHHRAAIALFEKLGMAGEVGRTLSTSIQAQILLGEYEAAIASAARARVIFESEKDDDWPGSRSTSGTSTTARIASPRPSTTTSVPTNSFCPTRTSRASRWRSATCRCV